MPKVAAIQMCSSAVIDENLETAARLIEQAAAHGAELIVLPEMFSIIGIQMADKVNVKETYGSGKVQDFLCEQALNSHVWIVGGTIPIACAQKNKVRAACIVYNNQGKAIARYDKTHLFDVTLSETESYNESDSTEPGNTLTVIDTPVGKIGIGVCYDLRFPELFIQLQKKGAEIIAIPAAFTVPTGQAHWQLLTRSRAVENFCYVIGAAQGGVHENGRQTYGHSLIVDPWGRVMQEVTESGPAVIYADINLNHLHDIRASIPVAQHRRNELY